MTELKDAAAELIAEVGFEAATLTAIAARAGASIGAVYQYFPDKGALAQALADDYGREISKRWGEMVTACEGLPLPTIVDHMCDLVLGFLAERPAFVPLLVAAPGYRHPAAERDQLRRHIATLLLAHRPDIAATETEHLAEIVVAIVKAVSVVIAGGSNAGRDQHREWAAAELRILLTAYLSTRLGNA